jgi:hypothetical protein
LVLPLYAVTLFVSAFLLFLVQPMIGTMILPSLGGTPQVWNTCMVFFQSALLAGYAYSHTVTTRLPLRKQMVVHGLFLLVPIAVLLLTGPFSVANFEPPPGANPIPYTMLFLSLVVGLPFIVVATSAPLLQRWFSYSGHESARDPYFLYGASNLGSMLSLLSYPFLVEPFLALRTQAWTWTVGYLLLGGLVLACAMMVWRVGPTAKPAEEVELPPSEIPLPPPVETTTAVKSGPPPAAARGLGRKKGAKFRPGPAKTPDKPEPVPTPAKPRPDVMTPWRRLRWVLLAAAPSSLMLGAITYISTDLSPIPLFWVLPLALYLLTFILVFARYPVPWTGDPHKVMLVVQPFLVLILCLIILHVIGVSPIWLSTSLTLLAFFMTAMMCHGELARDRPSPRHLTEFFLWMSVGGMLGGMFNGLVAPVVFTGVAEYPLALVLACLLRPTEKNAGWFDSFLSNSFPGLVPWIRGLGTQLGKIPLLNFVFILALGGAIVAGCVLLINESLELPPFGRLVLYCIGAIIVISVLAVRFKPENALALSMDMILALALLCLTMFLVHFGTYKWNWLSGDPAKNVLLRIVRSLGLDPQAWAQRAYYMVVYLMPLAITLFWASRPLRFGLGIGAILVANLYGTAQDERTLYATRSYFGVLQVNQRSEVISERELKELSVTDFSQLRPLRDSDGAVIQDTEGGHYFNCRYRFLMHGTTHHGLNYQVPKQLSRLATTYYHRRGPVGEIMERLNWFKGKQNTYHADARLPAALTALGGASLATSNLPMAQLVCAWSEPPYATVGLGTGTMASYGRPFQHVTFYEIDETIRSFHLEPFAAHRTEPFFTYLQGAVDRGVALEVIMGDARLSMKENRPGRLYLNRPDWPADGLPQQVSPYRENYYRAIELDAFSSDAIPKHLITRQAIEMYFTILSEQGVLCVHTSNRHVDLVKPVTDIAVDLGLKYRRGHDLRREDDRNTADTRGLFGSEYVMIARKDEYLPKDTGAGAAPIEWTTPAAPGNPVWTDDYSNLAGYLRESFAVTIFVALFAGIGVFVVLIMLVCKSISDTRTR